MSQRTKINLPERKKVTTSSRSVAISLYNAKFILLISASFITIFSSIAIYFCLPILLSHLIRQQITLSPTSGSYNDWRLNHVVDRFYLYNITNSLDLIEASQKSGRHSSRGAKIIPRLSQVGPFTFKQVREKTNIDFDSTNETVKYDQRKAWHFLPDSSVVKEPEELDKMYLNHMNVPLLGSVLRDPMTYSEIINGIVYEQDIKILLTHSVKELLFEGYFDILMEQGKSVGEIDIDRFGWMYNQNNTISKSYRVFTGSSNNSLDKFGAIDQYNFSNNLDIWMNPQSSRGKARCNNFRFSSAGEFFPPPSHSIISYNTYQQKNDQPDLETNHDSHNQTWNSDASDQLVEKKGQVISIFMPELCRTFELYYNRTYDYEGLTVDRYVADKMTFNYNEKPSKGQVKQFSKYIRTNIQTDENLNRCYCKFNESSQTMNCPPNGLMELYYCKKGNPVAISFPHFLYFQEDDTLKPYLSLIEDSVLPEEGEHQFYMDLESSLNLPIRAQVAIQFNVQFKNEPSYNFTNPYSFLFEQPDPNNSDGIIKTLDGLYMPQMWMQSRAEIDKTNLRNLKFLQHRLKLVTPIVTIIMFAIASVLLAMSAKMAYDLTYGPKSRKCSTTEWNELDEQARSECDDMLTSGHELSTMGTSSK